jgi:hypothetical protein
VLQKIDGSVFLFGLVVRVFGGGRFSEWKHVISDPRMQSIVEHDVKVDLCLPPATLSLPTVGSVVVGVANAFHRRARRQGLPMFVVWDYVFFLSGRVVSSGEGGTYLSLPPATRSELYRRSRKR